MDPLTSKIRERFVYKTELCRFVGMGKPCPYEITTADGKSRKCKFAHSLEELKPKICIYGATCTNPHCKYKHLINVETSSGEFYCVPEYIKEISAAASIEREAVRLRAFEILQDPRKSMEITKKNELCKVFLERGSCPYGDRCRFAHTQDELKIRDCLFGRFCAKIDCPFQHPRGKLGDKLRDEIINFLEIPDYEVHINFFPDREKYMIEKHSQLLLNPNTESIPTPPTKHFKYRIKFWSKLELLDFIEEESSSIADINIRKIV